MDERFSEVFKCGLESLRKSGVLIGILLVVTEDVGMKDYHVAMSLSFSCGRCDAALGVFDVCKVGMKDCHLVMSCDVELGVFHVWGRDWAIVGGIVNVLWHLKLGRRCELT
eukprot:1376543-Amorphochlora_amoeboformis.AAC.1